MIFRILSVIIPAFNERATIYFDVHKLNKVKLLSNIEKGFIFASDCCTYNTESIIFEYMSNNAD